jgi:zinc-finger binding domain of transposase IS66
MRLDLEHQACPCCGGELHLIGETVSEMLDHVPARLRVIRICRPRYGCRACGTIHQAPAPECPIAKGHASRRIAELYAIEGSIRGRSAKERRHVRYTSARPLIDMMKPWLETELAAFHPPAPSPKPFVMRSRAGQPSPDSSTTAASNSTTIQSSAPSGPSRSGAKTICSRARTVAESDG